MMRTLHVIDQPGETGQAPLLRLSLAAARETTDARHQHAWLLVGGQPICDAARSVGINESKTRLVPRPEGLRKLLPGALRGIKELMTQADRVVCWGPGATQLASLVSCAHAKPRYAEIGLNDFTKRAMENAVDAQRGEGPALRESLRKRWGVGPEAFVVALLADQPELLDVHESLLSIAFTHEMLRSCKAQRGDIRLLCDPAARGRLGATELSELLAFPDMLIQDAGLNEPWRTLWGCDLALVPDPGLAPLSLLCAGAVGLPIIASGSPYIAGLDAIDNIRLTRGPAGKQLAHALTTWALEQSPAERILI